ncbi:MAG: single-stranded DNA-binding protein, partial [Chloroflexi bacterium]|nr:single-stranded DNA-binding protein [Chloroflexota bacterium]
FDIVVEIQDRDKVAIHPDVAQAVDATLRGQLPSTEIRWLDETGEVRIEKIAPVATAKKTAKERPPAKESGTHRLYLFGVNRGRFEEMIKDAHPNVEIVENLDNASLFVTSKHHYRRKPQKVKEAEAANLPVYVLRSNTPIQIGQFLRAIHPSDSTINQQNGLNSFQAALSEAQEAVNLINNGQPEVELSPQSAYIRRLQHLIAERNTLLSKSSGKEPRRRVRIYKG